MTDELARLRQLAQWPGVSCDHYLQVEMDGRRAHREGLSAAHCPWGTMNALLTDDGGRLVSPARVWRRGWDDANMDAAVARRRV